MSFHAELLPEPLPDEPLRLLARWLDEAAQARSQPNPNAMVLATADAQGVPSARVVLCKDLDATAGYVTFFSNYDSRKGRELAVNARAAAVMHWDTLRRQVRLEGPITRTTRAESAAYFSSRSWQSRVSAWASHQSEPIGSRAEIQQAVEEAAMRLRAPSPRRMDAAAADPGVVIPVPDNWGGYHLWIEKLELWVEGEARLHDRARWQRTLTPAGGGFEGNSWQATRLQP